jgi:hypothetical protein
MKKYYLFGGNSCDIFTDSGIEVLKAEALKTDITSFGDVICFNSETMDLNELMDFAILWCEYIEITEIEYNDLAKFWLENY